MREAACCDCGSAEHGCGECPTAWTPTPMDRTRYYVRWGDVELGWTDSQEYAEYVIARHIERRRRVGGDTPYRSDYRIVTAA